MDRDLAVLEPTLFRDVSWAGQVVARDGGTFVDGRLVPSSGSLELVRVGMVIRINEGMYEVTSVADDVLRISVLRGGVDDEVMVPQLGGPVNFVVTTFMPQIGVAHREVLNMLGLREGPTGAQERGLDGRLGEDRVKNPRELVLVESLGALRLIYGAAGSLLGDSSPMSRRSKEYQRRFAEERWRTSARIDADGDGIADTTRRLSVSSLIRG